MNIHRIFFGIFFLFAIIYLVTIPIQPFSGHFVIKAIPILSLAAMVCKLIPGLKGKLLLAALLFSAAGDVTLSLESGDFFIFGLGFFLFAHIIYIVTFSRDFQMQKSRIPISTILIAYAAIIAIILTPSLKDMALPVYAYLVVISTMGIFAAFRNSIYKLVLVGAILFITSDSIIAINKFLVPILFSDYLVMTSYYLAQFFIVSGFFRELNAQATSK